MKELKLTKYVQTNATVLDNEFIDHYMVRANGEYVKVYLLLLRHMNQSSGYLSVSELADLLECTEERYPSCIEIRRKARTARLSG